MQKRQSTALFKHKPLPGWAGWLLGYAAALCAAAGLVYFWRVIFSLGNAVSPVALTLGAMGFASLVVLAVFVLCRFAKNNFCLRAAILVFLCGLLFCFATAPLQAPDEDKHFLRANAISRGHFTYQYNEDFPDDVHLLIEKFKPKLAHDIQFAGRQLAPAALAEYRLAVRQGAAPATRAQAPVLFMLLPFLHQGLFMAAARLLGFTALGQMYAGRLANLLLYAVLCYFALRNARRGRTVLLAFMLLPLSLFMGASCSYDGMMLALFYLMASYFFKAELTNRDLGVFLAALALITYIKPHNVVLAALLLFIPKSRWRARWRAGPVVAVLAAAALALWWGLGALDSGVLKIGYPALARGSGQAAGPGAQLLFVLQHPLRFVATALQSVYEADGFLFDLGRFGWMDLVVPLVGGLSVLGLCLATVLGVEEKADDKKSAITGLVVLGLVYAAAVLAGMYVLDTDVGSIRITGQQPRYFLPAFALLFAAGGMALSRVMRPRLATPAAVLRRQNAVLWVCAALALLAAVLVFQNYFVGQWLPKSEGGWKMVNFLGLVF